VPYKTQQAIVELQVTFAVYVTALTGWVGWFFFAIFGGVGLAVLPIDLVAEFIWRPRYMDAVEYAEHQVRPPRSEPPNKQHGSRCSTRCCCCVAVCVENSLTSSAELQSLLKSRSC
jgi:hypothetical protein